MSQLPKIITTKMEALSPSTRRLYSRWLVKFYAHSLTPLSRVKRGEVAAFLVSLARSRVSASYQNTALSAIRWLVTVTEQDVDLSGLFARRPQRMPSAASHAEATDLIARLWGDARAIVALVYGSGLTLSEAVNLRADQLALASRRIYVSEDRSTVLPKTLVNQLFLFSMLSDDGLLFHTSALAVHRALKRAVLDAGLTHPIGTRELRFGFAARLLEQGTTIIEVQQMMGYRQIDTLLKIQDQITLRSRAHPSHSDR